MDQHLTPAAGDFQGRAFSRIVGAVTGLGPGQGQGVGAHRQAVADRQHPHRLHAPVGLDAGAQNENADPYMGERHAKGAARERCEASKHLAKGGLADPQTRAKLDQGPDDQIGSKPYADQNKDRAGLCDDERDQRRRERRQPRQPQALRRAHAVAPLPGQERSQGHDHETDRHQGRKGQVEEGRADAEGVAGRRLIDKGIEGSRRHRQGGRGQEQIIDHQPAFAADQGKQRPRFQHRRAPDKQGQGRAHRQGQNDQENGAARRIDREGVDRGQNP